jgi:hypothetical protein
MKIGGGCRPQASNPCGEGAKAKGASGEKGGSGEKAQAKAEGVPYGQYKKHLNDGFEGGDCQGGDSHNTLDDRSGGGGGFLSGIFGSGGLLGGLFGGNNDYLNYANSTPTAVNGAKNTAPPAPPVDLGNANSLSANAKPLPWVSQNDPTGKDANYLNGAENCGPAVLAMIAKANGKEPLGTTDAQFISNEMKVAGTNAQGTTGNGMIAALQNMGMQTAANPGGDLNWINSQLQQGHDVIANGDFYSVPGHTDPTLVAGHYIAVTGVNQGVYTVSDPAAQNAGTLTMTADQLQAFIAAHPQGGFTIATW